MRKRFPTGSGSLAHGMLIPIIFAATAFADTGGAQHTQNADASPMRLV